MEDVNATRRRRLELLRSQRNENWKELAKALGTTASYISQIRSGTRELGEKTARKFERKLGLPNGWFDRSEGDDLQKSEKPFSTDLVVDVAMEVMRIADRELKMKLSPTQIRRIAGMAAVQAEKTGKVDSDYIRQLVSLTGSG